MGKFGILAKEINLKLDLIKQKFQEENMKIEESVYYDISRLEERIDYLEKRVKYLEDGKTFVEVEIELEPDIYEYVRKKSEESGKTMNDIVVDAITSVMKLYEKYPGMDDEK